MRTIDADALIKAISISHSMTDDYGVQTGYVISMKLIDVAPTIEPKRKKGKWQITDAYPHNVYCSECHTRFAQTHWAVWEDGSLPRNFCPNCGADMREETDAV